jgi:cytochrome c55X
VLRLWTGACAAALVLGASAAAAQGTSSAETAGVVDAGRKLYVSSCTRCHGINLVVGSSAFYDLRNFPRDDKERFVLSVSKGKRAMPAWEGLLKAEEIDAIWAYIGSVNGWPAK